MLDVGLLLLRLVVGLLLVGHGLQKLTGWFGGPGREGNARYLESLGYRRAQTLSSLHGVAELGGGALIGLGLLTPLAATAIIAVMVNAVVTAHAGNGLWVQDGGYEYPLVLGSLAASLALTGTGRFGLDAVLGWASSATWSVLGIGTGLLVGFVVLWLGRASETVPSGSRQEPGSPAAAS